MTIPKALKRANPDYRCAHFGKWGEKMISSPEECGYDASDGQTSNGIGGMEQKNEPYHIAKDPKRTRAVTGRAIAFMREQVDAGKPFYAQVSYYAVHLRIELLEKTLLKYQSKGAPDRSYSVGWAGMLEELDAGIGELLGALDELGISENTYVFFMSDNGGRGTVPGGDEKSLPTNHPLSGAKHSLREGGIRVPFFVRGPNIQAGSVCHVPVVGYDLLPTFHELAGEKGVLSDELDGGSFTPLLTNPNKGIVKRSLGALVFHRPKRLMSAIRQDDHKLFINWDKSGKIKSCALYEIQSDFGEKRDLSASDPLRTNRLKSMVTNYLTKVDAIKSSDFGASSPKAKKPSRVGKNKRLNPAANFKRRDKKGDRFLTLVEFIGNPKIRNVPAMKRQFKAKDGNNDSRLTLEELKKAR